QLRLAFAQHLERGGEELWDNALRTGGVAADKICQHIDRQHVLAPAFVLGDDLQEILPGEVVTRLEVDDLDLAPLADERGDVFERHIVAGFRVVEPTARVPLDQKRLGILCHISLSPRRIGVAARLRRTAENTTKRKAGTGCPPGRPSLQGGKGWRQITSPKRRQRLSSPPRSLPPGLS